MDLRLRALNRFGLGARVGEARTLADPRGWLTAQLDVGAADARGGASLDEVAVALQAFNEAQRTQEEARLRDARWEIGRIKSNETDLLLDTRVRTDTPFVERLVAFWSNHLCVSVAKGSQVPLLAGHYERNVVRPHVLGRFADMVLASARHPAMLYYLDNVQSIGPDSPAARRPGRRGQPRGLNENYARELLELHTVGVEGGYDQNDVIALARVLTGWTVAGAGSGASTGGRYDFVFRPALHEPGAKTVMGRRYEESGAREGEDAIRDLCAHPATARFLATKLVRHFVADDPPGVAVDRIAAVYRDTDGDLGEVSRALVGLDEAWDEGSWKFRTPLDWLTAVFRAVGAEDAPRQIAPLLGQLRQPVWEPTAPKGFGDMTHEWADPDSLMNRAELARTLAPRVLRGRQSDPRLLLDVVDVPEGDPLRTMLADTSIGSPERFALAVGGPAFQWR